MGDRLERLFSEWHRLGGRVLLAEVDASVPVRPPEQAVADSTAHCRESSRLTWVVLDWLICHIAELDEQILLEGTAERGDLSVLGVLCDAARQRNPDPKFARLMQACVPHEELVPFFHRVARSPLASRLTRAHALDLFRRWNYLSSELRYLADEGWQADGVGHSPAARPVAGSARPT